MPYLNKSCCNEVLDEGNRLYVQVSYLLASEEAVRREFGAFAGIPDFLLATEWN